jgi:hypothetical protein
MAQYSETSQGCLVEIGDEDTLRIDGVYIVNSAGNAAGPLTRAFGRGGLATLSTQADIELVLGVTPYDSPPCPGPWGPRRILPRRIFAASSRAEPVPISTTAAVSGSAVRCCR